LPQTLQKDICYRGFTLMNTDSALSKYNVSAPPHCLQIDTPALTASLAFRKLNSTAYEASFQCRVWRPPCVL